MESVKAPWNQRLGGIGEAEINKCLLYFSIPTKYDLDVGIDYYCELLENSSPTDSFYVQAKGTEHFDDDWGRSIKKSTIMYWLTRPFPVFLMIYDEKEKECYWMSIEDKRYELLTKMDSASESIHIKVDKSRILIDGKDMNNEFIKKIRDDLVSIGLWQGHPIPKGREYVKQMPGPPRSNIELRRSKSYLRMNISSLIQHYMLVEDWDNAYICCDFLTKFDKNHYNHFVWFGQINAIIGNKEKARKSYEEALNICERDKKWPKESMDRLKESIKREIAEIK